MGDRLILTGATPIDGSAAEPAPGRAVVVERGRIVSVRPADREPDGDTLRLDGSRSFPG